MATVRLSLVEGYPLESAPAIMTKSGATRARSSTCVVDRASLLFRTFLARIPKPVVLLLTNRRMAASRIQRKIELRATKKWHVVFHPLRHHSRLPPKRARPSLRSNKSTFLHDYSDQLSQNKVRSQGISILHSNNSLGHDR